MQNNENQDIRTDFKANDVFKPSNANQLAKSIHYDFVITQDMFNTYVTNQAISEAGIVDIGNVIASKRDGSQGSWAVKVKAPVSIYISANTSNYKLEFTSRLISDSDDGILDTSDFKDHGSFTRAKTVNMVNVYSAYPYEVNTLPTCGFNLWSTINAPVIINTNTRSFSGVCKIGYYKLDTPFDLGLATDVCIVASNALGTYKFKQTPSDNQSMGSYTPAVVFANWMGGQGVTTEYEINSNDTSLRGLYQSMVSTRYDYSCDIALIEHNEGSQRIYYLSQFNSTRLLFTDAATGNTISIDKSGTITRNTAISALSSKVVIFQLGLDGTSTYNTDGLYSVLTEYGNQISVLRQGYGFLTVPQDADKEGLLWYDQSVPFKFKSASTLDIYTWYGVKRRKISDSSMFIEYNGQSTTKSTVYVDFNDLTEGVVYEINVHILKLPIDSIASGEFEQMSPYDDNPDAPSWGVTFVDGWDAKQFNRWGITAIGGKQLHTLAPYTWFQSNTKPESEGGYKRFKALSELAYATLRFVRLGSEVFVMNY